MRPPRRARLSLWQPRPRTDFNELTGIWTLCGRRRRCSGEEDVCLSGMLVQQITAEGSVLCGAGEVLVLRGEFSDDHLAERQSGCAASSIVNLNWPCDGGPELISRW